MLVPGTCHVRTNQKECQIKFYPLHINTARYLLLYAKDRPTSTCHYCTPKTGQRQAHEYLPRPFVLCRLPAHHYFA